SGITLNQMLRNALSPLSAAPQCVSMSNESEDIYKTLHTCFASLSPIDLSPEKKKYLAALKATNNLIKFALELERTD
ncbi:MAG: hypothetical protein HQK53_07045, partial [Oligoflexia bacterium]|nr:hypothetical protein [Oligoflexia bacterium]